MSLSWCITLSSINIYYLPETVEEYYKNYSDFGIYLNLVHGPVHFNVSKIPNDIKPKVIEKLETIPRGFGSVWYQLPGIIGFINNGQFQESTWKDFEFYINKHDDYRHQEFAKTFKEYYELFSR